ncbi:Pentatricopeptide repeat domain 3, partial [Operophtera brumata]
AERAHQLSQEALELGVPLSTSVYNSLLGCGISPNEETLSSCLRSVSVWGGGKLLQELALQIVSEFRKLGIQPGLSAYYYLLCLFCKEKSRDKLNPKEATDTNFFITAMGVCSDHLQIIKTLELSGAGDRLAQAWSQLVIFGHAKKIRLVENLLSAMANCYQYQGTFYFSKARSTHVNLCADTSDQADPVWEAVEKAIQLLKSEEAAGVPARPQALADVAVKAATVGKQGIAAAAVSYLAECGFEEAVTASQQVLSVMLNRPEPEVQTLLDNEPAALASSLHPAALAVAQSYH